MVDIVSSMEGGSELMWRGEVAMVNIISSDVYEGAMVNIVFSEVYDGVMVNIVSSYE